jgi:hypothetical protein
MRGLRSTIALLVILIGLCAYIYFVTFKTPEGGAQGTQERVFAALDAEKIDELKVKSDSGETTSVKKDAGTWQITAPLAVRADAMEIGSITNNLSTLEITRVVDENPADLKEYGLDSPRVEVEFKAAGDKDYGDYHRLFIGGKAPTGGDLFARRDAEKRVILIPAHTDPIFNRSTFNLRDKALLAVDREKVDRIAVSAAGPGAPERKTLELARDAGGWKLTSPTEAIADTSAADALLGRVQGAVMKAVAAEQATPADLKKYGFDRPQGTVTLHAGGASTSLVFGGNVNETDVYVRDASKPLVATADVTLLDELRKAPEDYRRKNVFGFSRYTADRLEFTRDGQPVVFEKVKSQELTPDKWRRVSPNAGEPDAMNMDDLLTKLEGLRATSFINSTAGTGLDKPSLTVNTKFENGTKEDRVSFGRSISAVYAGIAGQPGAAEVSAAEFDEAIKALELVSK